jgi:long-chain acyl-CoA synthetase
MLSHRNVLSNVEAVVAAFHVAPDDRMLSILPLHHTFENTVGFLGPLRAGASVAYGRGLKSTELREDLRTSKTTILLGVPLLYEKLVASIRRAIDEAPPVRRAMVATLLGLVRAGRALDLRLGGALLRPVREASGLSAIRLFVSGAAPLAPDVFWGLTDFGWTVLEGYGLTECSPVVAANRPEKPMPGTVGRPVPGVEVRIVDPDADGDGEIAVRGPNVMLGYFEDIAATSETIRDGWLMTGDLGRIDARGNLRITGRLKNMIATAAGKKIYPEEVETLISRSPIVREVVVVGGRDARGEREEVHAHVVPDLEAIEARAAVEGRTADEAYIEKLVRGEVERLGGELAAYKRVKRGLIRKDPFPRTSTGKVRRPAGSAGVEGA